MRIVKKPSPPAEAPAKALAAGGAPAPAPVSTSNFDTSVKLGFEDLLVAMVIIIVLAAWAAGQLTIQQVLSYLGVSTTGGVWGLLSGKSSS
jgi:hypothetical protein